MFINKINKSPHANFKILIQMTGDIQFEFFYELHHEALEDFMSINAFFKDGKDSCFSFCGDPILSKRQFIYARLIEL